MPVEHSRADDPFLDFCLWDYEPAASPLDKLRSINLLNQSFDTAGGSARLRNLCEAIRAHLGDWRTVWGVKNFQGRLAWEFYFYDYRRLDRMVSISRVLEVIREFTHCDLEVNEDCLYFMFSVDVDDDMVIGRKSLDHINVYLGDVSHHVSAGICYNLDRSGLRLDNLYHFFDAQTDMREISDKVVASLHLRLQDFDLNTVLIPGLVDCRTIVIANKKYNDGVYFCRINIKQLIFFLELMGYPQEIQAYIRQHRDKLDHMLYDVGIDYRMEAGKIRYLKSSYYGVF